MVATLAVASYWHGWAPAEQRSLRTLRPTSPRRGTRHEGGDAGLPWWLTDTAIAAGDDQRVIGLQLLAVENRVHAGRDDERRRVASAVLADIEEREVSCAFRDGMPAHDARVLSIHESSHCIGAVVFGLAPKAMKYTRDGATVQYSRGPVPAEVTACGPVGETLAGFNGARRENADHDALIRRDVGDSRAPYIWAETTLRAHWPAVRSLADTFLRRGYLSVGEIRELLTQSLPQSVARSLWGGT